MDRGCISVWVEKQLTLNERLLLQKYEYFLMDYGLGYSFSYEYRGPKFSSKYERKQVESALGFITGQEIMICGLADPMFIAAEAIMKYFHGNYQMHITNDIAQYLKGEYYAIRKRIKFGIPKDEYYLVDWQFIAGYFNQMDDEKIRNVYSIERLWKSKPNYGVGIN